MPTFLDVTRIAFSMNAEELTITHDGTAQTTSLSTSGAGQIFQIIYDHNNSYWTLVNSSGEVDVIVKPSGERVLFTEINTAKSGSDIEFRNIGSTSGSKPMLDFIGVIDIRDALTRWSIEYKKARASIRTTTDHLIMRKQHHDT